MCENAGKKIILGKKIKLSLKYCPGLSVSLEAQTTYTMNIIKTGVMGAEIVGVVSVARLQVG